MRLKNLQFWLNKTQEKAFITLMNETENEKID